MQPTLLAWQARILLVVGLGSLALGFYVGVDPLTATWRAAAAAWAATLVSGWLLRIVAATVAESAAASEAGDAT